MYAVIFTDCYTVDISGSVIFYHFISHFKDLLSVWVNNLLTDFCLTNKREKKARSNH